MSLDGVLLALHSKLQLFNRPGFLSSVVTLVGGTAFSQALAIVALPALTRIYSPTDFSVLAVYVSLVTVASVSACLRLDIAIPMPHHDDEAANLLMIALCSCTAISLIACTLVALFPREIDRMTGHVGLRPYLWLVPLGIWLTSVYAAVQFWATRKKRFAAIAKTRLSQTVGGLSLQLLFGCIGLGPVGLLIGNLVSNGAGVAGLCRGALKRDKSAFAAINLTEMQKALKKYQSFPRFSTFDAIFNTAAIQVPLVIISAFAAGPEAGYLMLAMRAMAVPMNLVGSSVAQVYLSEAPGELRRGNLGKFSSQVLNGLVRGGVGPLLFAGIIAPRAFALIFGPHWDRAGELVAWMTPWFILQFMSSPISMIMHITGRQRAMLVLTLLGFGMRLGVLGLAAQFYPKYLSEAYAVSGAIYYLVCYLIFSTTAKVQIPDWIRLNKSNLALLGIWIAAGVMVQIILEIVA